jgi:hypothetical protein
MGLWEILWWKGIDVLPYPRDSQRALYRTIRKFFSGYWDFSQSFLESLIIDLISIL